jgi:hypothetical protein
VPKPGVPELLEQASTRAAIAPGQSNDTFMFKFPFATRAM